MMRRTLLILATLIVLGAFAAACSSSSSTPKGTPGARSTAQRTPSGGTSQITATLKASTATAAVGATAQTTVQALAVPAPGLGAWTFDVAYDPAIVSVTNCTYPGAGACNPRYNNGPTLRLAGATAQGLTGDTTLATVTFQCSSAGTSSLKLTVDLLADATLGNPLNIPNPTLQDGSITCS
jgi:hypothetical protein